jgi:outer membrane protein insertion porin family
MRKLFLALSLALAALACLQAQDLGAYEGKTIKDVQFTGLVRVSSTELEAIVKPFIAKPLTTQIVEDLQRRLYELEYFDSVLADFQPAVGDQSAVVVSFDVIERATIDEVVIRGNDSQRSTDILAEVVLKAGKPVLRPKIALDQENIRKYYIKNGYADVAVDWVLEEGKKPNSRRLVFMVNEGYRTSVRKVQFSGNKFASESALKGLLKTAEQTLFNTGVFQEANLDLDRQAILKYYRDNGFVDVKLVDINRASEFAEKEKRNYLTVIFYIEEGTQWNFGGVRITGNEIFPQEKLMSMVHSKVGSVVNYSRLQSEYQAIADLYYQNGYINNGISLDFERNEETKTISAIINIEEKGRAYIENIVIRGNKKTDPSVILRALPFETGDVFSSRRIREGLMSLTNLRYFSNIVPETPAGSEPGLYDLILDLTEQNTIDLRLGVSLTGSADIPVAGFVHFGDTNFLGKGMDLSAELNIGASEQKVTASFSDPWLFGKNWGGGISLSFDRATKTGVPVDMAGPVFNGQSNAVPDPYDGHYVFSSDAGAAAYNSDNGTALAKGADFPGVPTSADIVKYSLVTDYAYAGGSSSIPSAYTMSYTNWDIGLGLSTGKRESTLAGWFSWSVNGNVELNYVDYDQTKYRPFDAILRNNYMKFQFINSIGFRLGLDARDITYDPGNGYYISEGVSLVGGLLGGERHYIQSSTQIQGYLTLWDMPVTDTSNWKTVLAAGSSLDVLFPQFFNYQSADGNVFSPNFVASDRMLYTNTMTVGRGWPSVGNGQALWDNWLEIRTPLFPQILSLDSYFEAVRISTSRDDIFSLNTNGWMFGFGIGLRILNPSLPLRLYIGKRFNLDSAGNVVWQKGNILATDQPGSGADLILAFSLTN